MQRRTTMKTALKGRAGAFDLPSIIVAVVVVGILTAGVLAAIFGIIPFAQDNGSKQDVAAVRTAEGVARTKDGKFMDTAGLTGAGYLPKQTTAAAGDLDRPAGDVVLVSSTEKLKVVAGVNAKGDCYIALGKSGTGKIFWGSEKASDALELTPTDDPGCLTATELKALVDSIGGFTSDYGPATPAVTGTVSSRTVAVFTWPSVDGATGYRVEYRINGGDWVSSADNQAQTTASIAAAETDVVDARITARNSSGTSGYGTASVKLADRIIANGGFEAGLNFWTPSGAAAASGAAHSGAGSTLLGDTSTTAKTSSVSQSVTIPDSVNSTLTYSYAVYSSGASYDCNDQFNVKLYNGATLVRNVQSGCASLTAGWVTRTIDVTAQKGKTLNLSFEVYNNGTSYSATARVDDVALTTTPPTPTAAPTAVGASAIDGGATLSWVAPTSLAVPITSYTVTPYLNGSAQAPIQVAAPATKTTVTGFTNGSSYAFTVKANNAAGASAESAQTVTVVPGPVNIVNAGFENGTDGWTVAGWYASADPNAHTGVGSLKLTNTQILENTADVSQNVAVPDNAVTSLKLWYSVPTVGAHNGNVQVRIIDSNGVYRASPVNVSSATSGWVQATADLTSYRGQTIGIHLYGHDYGGQGAYLAYFDDVSVTSTPSTAPAAPPGLTASAGDTAATIKWSAPASPGSTITGYTVTPYLNGAGLTPVQTTARTVTIPGLTNGSNYTFTVRATNAIGTSPESAPSGAVTPSQVALANGGFEGGLASWTTAGTRLPYSSNSFHTGAKSAALGGQSGTGTLTQTFTVPSAGTTTASFWYKTSTSQSSCSYDLLGASVLDGFGTTVSNPLNTYVCSANNSDPWKQVTVDLSAYKGQQMSIKFSMSVSSLTSTPGTATIDDVVLSTH